MALFVYVTEECRDNARRHALSDELDRFKERVEATQSTSQFDPFPPPYLVKKKLGGRQGRLIADLRTQGDHTVVVFLAILIRGDKAYENQFSVDPIGYGKQHFNHLISSDQLTAYIGERARIELPPAKAEPNEVEYGFLYEAFAHRQSAADEDMVYETIEWKEAVAEERIATQLVRFAQPCLDALSQETGIHFLKIPGKTGWGLWVHRSEGRLLLITPVTDASSEKAGKIADRYREQLGGVNLTHIIRSSRRAYPAYMLADEDTWVEIEKEPVANMALSPEESEVLLSSHRPEGAFPLFVNGRAGSGKSTILQYLFADLLYYYLSNREAQVLAPPVYLTANGELLRVARSFIERILRNEAVFRGSESVNIVEANREILDEAFWEFQPRLLSMVDTRDRLERFALSHRVDYSQRLSGN